MIAKNIIQTADSFDALPRRIRENIDFLQSKNPDWRYLFFDRKKALEVIDAVGFDVSALNLRYGAMIADLFRYSACYLLGGFYLDIKSTCKNSLSSVVRFSDVFLPRWAPRRLNSQKCYTGMSYIPAQAKQGMLCQWAFYTNKHHVFLASVIETIKENFTKYDFGLHGGGKIGIIKMTGPGLFTKVALELNLYNGAKIYSNYGLRYTVFDSMTAHHNLFAVHYSKLTEPLLVGPYVKKFNKGCFEVSHE